jgi:hypothetical protein
VDDLTTVRSGTNGIVFTVNGVTQTAVHIADMGSGQPVVMFYNIPIYSTQADAALPPGALFATPDGDVKIKT